MRGLGETGLLDEAETIRALILVDDRNRTVHTYLESVATSIFGRLTAHTRLMGKILRGMLERMPSA